MEKIVYAVLNHALPHTISIEDVRAAIDTEYTKLQEAVQQNIWPAELKQYIPYKDEFSEVDNIVLRGNKIVIPLKLQNAILILAHEGHAENEAASTLESMVAKS
jgi:hypothetical protein